MIAALPASSSIFMRSLILIFSSDILGFGRVMLGAGALGLPGALAAGFQILIRSCMDGEMPSRWMRLTTGDAAPPALFSTGLLLDLPSEL